MNFIKYCCFLTAILVLFFPVSAYTQTIENNNIIGKWESVNRSNTGIGSSYIFYPDGKFKFITGAMIDYIYHKDNNRLITTFVNVFTKEVTKDTSFIEIKGDTLYQQKTNDGENKYKIYTRAKEDNREKGVGLTGKWKSQNQAGQTAYYEFQEDGVLYFRLPYEIKIGNFRINGNKITFDRGDRERTENFKIENNFLTITGNSGSEQTYHKIN